MTAFGAGTAQAWAERDVFRIFDGIAHTYDQVFYERLVTVLTDTLPIDAALIGLVDLEGAAEVRCLAYCLDGRLQAGFSYPLQGTPCATLLDDVGQPFCLYRENIQCLFPDDPELVELGMEGYLGFPLKDRHGRVTGLMVLLSRAPLEMAADAIALLRLVASRLEAEIERGLAEDRRVLNELSLQQAEKIANLGGWVVNLDSGRVFCSEGMCRLYGLPPERREHPREATLGRVHPDDRDAFLAVTQAAIEEARGYRLQHRILLPDGSEKWIRTQAEPLVAEGRVFELLGVSQDITEEVLAQRKVFESESRLRELIAASPQGITQVDTQFNLVYANRVAHEIHGYRDGEMTGRPMSDFMPPQDVARFQQRLLSLTPEKNTISYQRRGIAADGSALQLEVAISLMQDQQGNTLGYIGFISDITDKERSKTLLRQLSTAVEQSPSSILITDLNGDIQYANPAFCSNSGYRSDEVVGQPLGLLQTRQSQDGFDQMRQRLASGEKWQGELLSQRSDGSYYWGLTSGAPIKDSSGQTTHYVVIQEDISVRKEQEQQLAYQANYDAVTGLPNRLLAMDRLTHGIVASRRKQRHTVVMFVDLDQFKRINDSFGHSTGDKLLVNAAALLQQAVRENDTVARFGGDEFLVIMDSVPDQEAVEKVSEKVLRAFNKPVYIGDHELLITASIGVAVYPQDGRDAETLLRNADAAMYSAKSRGRNCFHFFTPMMNKLAQERLRIESHLQRALEFQEMYLHYQPLVCLKTGRIVAAEALLRWHCEKLGFVAPDRFIPLAEDLGFIEELGNWVIREVLQQYAQWRDRGLLPAHFRCAINVSPKQFQRGQLAQTIFNQLQRLDIPPAALELEVTEGLLMESWPEVDAQIRQLTAAGISLSIDDFGTGFSSISYLRKYPFRTLKIDRSFIQDVLSDPSDATLVQSIIALARGMGMETIAEGVEEEGHCTFLREAGCTLMQGYYFSKPLPPQQLIEMLARQHRLD